MNVPSLNRLSPGSNLLCDSIKSPAHSLNPGIDFHHPVHFRCIIFTHAQVGFYLPLYLDQLQGSFLSKESFYYDGLPKRFWLYVFRFPVQLFFAQLLGEDV